MIIGFDFDWYGWDGEDDPRLRLVTAKTVRKALRILNRHWETDNEEGDAVEEPLPETLTPQEQQERQAQQAKEAEEILRAIARHSI